MNKYNVVIGIEIHLELLTKTKMFASAPVVFGAKPNTSVDETVLAYPGSMPCVNKKAVELAIQACHLLNLSITNKLIFDRKHYNYHDLPKGFQITQNEFPLGSNGFLKLNDKKISIQRAHIEEDTAKTIKQGNNILIDYNRCGNPLLEIVTDPDFSTAQEVVDYVNTIKHLMFYAGISNSKMEEGSLRCDVNISLNLPKAKEYGQRVEIKNINSTANIAQAIAFEIQRHTDILNAGGKVEQDTRRFDEDTQTTITMRSKDDTLDYRYIRETNIAPITLEQKSINDAVRSIEFNATQFIKNLAKTGLTKEQINEIMNQTQLKDYIINFEKHNANSIAKDYFKIMLNVLSPLVKQYQTNNLTPKQYAEFIHTVVNDGISHGVYKKVLESLVKTGGDVTKTFVDNKIDFVEDQDTLIKIISDNLTAELKDTYTNRPERVEKQLMALVMKNTQGKANPKIAMQLIKEILSK